MIGLIPLITLAIPCIAASPVELHKKASCFPYGDAKLPTDLSLPKKSIKEWWCPQSMAYGFQGFSYPVEDFDCSAYSNSYDSLNHDFAQMSRDFGARVVRLYYPNCAEKSFLENVIRAAVANNMAVVFQVATNFGIGNFWKQSQQSIYDILADSKYGPLVPYVVHSADFGSEPVGDDMDNAQENNGTQFVSDLAKFRAHMHAHNIQAGISEDWDRPGIMSSENDQSLGPVGKGVAKNSDYAHIHPMPFYHFNDPVSQAWPYIEKEVLRVKRITHLPTTITETQWAWGETDHNPNKSDVGVPQYQEYWKTIDRHCEFFREHNVGWFFHAWTGEGTLSITFPNGSYVIPDWRPRKC